MAYYDEEYSWPQQHTPYDLVAYQDSVSFSSYQSYDLDTYPPYPVSELQETPYLDKYHQTQGYDYNYDYNDNSFSSVSPGMNYFAYNYAEPKLIAYEPVTCDTGYVSYHTHYSISRPERDLKFNETEFEEYDPTPYDGGYDIVSVYGKPLPPSDQTCYPRSNPKSIEPNSKPVANPIPLVDPKPIPQLVPVPIPIPEPETKTKTEIVHVPVPIPIPEPEPETKTKTETEIVHVPVPMPEALESRELGEGDFDYGFDYPWPEYDHGYGIGVGYDYGYGKQMVQVPPCEYSAEVVDLCENIFGSWPCLARIRRQQMDVNNNNSGTTCPENGHYNSWEECVTSIFGRPVTSYYR